MIENFEDLKCKTFVKIEGCKEGSEEIIFYTATEKYRLVYHDD